MARPVRPALDGVEPREAQLGELVSEYKRLRAARHRTREQLDGLLIAIDERTDACLRAVRELVSRYWPSADGERAVTVLEIQLRRLAVLRARTLVLYTAEPNPGADA